MTPAQGAVVAVLVVVVVLGLLWASSRLTGQIAERFGEEPTYWQKRMLPFGPLGPILLWFLLNQRGGGGGIA